MATGLENLKIYTMAAELELRVHSLTAKFPTDEKYRSVDQLRRSSASVSNNIAESYHKRTFKEKLRILHDIAKGEAEETKRNLDMCLKKEFHNDGEIVSLYTELLKAISGYIKFLRTKELPNLLTSQLN
jgi:four helix bundle protein